MTRTVSASHIIEHTAFLRLARQVTSSKPCCAGSASVPQPACSRPALSSVFASPDAIWSSARRRMHRCLAAILCALLSVAGGSCTRHVHASAVSDAPEHFTADAKLPSFPVHNSSDGLAVSPDGTKVAVAYSGVPRNTLQVLDLAAHTVLTIEHPEAEALLRDPIFSADGSQIALIASFGFDKTAGDVFVVDLKTMTAKFLVGQDGRDRRLPCFIDNSTVAFWEDQRDPYRASLAIPYTVVSVDADDKNHGLALPTAYAYPNRLLSKGGQLFFSASAPLVWSSISKEWRLPAGTNPFARAHFTCELRQRNCAVIDTIEIREMPNEYIRLVSTDGSRFLFYGPSEPGSRDMVVLRADEGDVLQSVVAPAFGSIDGFFTAQDSCAVGQLTHGLGPPRGLQRLCFNSPLTALPDLRTDSPLGTVSLPAP